MAKKKKTARGRPFSGGETPKRNFRMSDADFQRVQAAADAAEKSTSEWIRETLLKAAAKGSI